MSDHPLSIEWLLDERLGIRGALLKTAPTEEILANANQSGDFNDCSYVLLYMVGGKRILFGGDSHDVSWQHILTHHRVDVENVDLLIAPHHGRDSGGYGVSVDADPETFPKFIA